jgi:serine/threonine protein kinase
MVMDTPAAGTLAYMAPEAREGRVDKRADVYGVGALLHEMIHGAPPHALAAIVVRDDLPAGLATVLAKALAPDPDARYPSARALADELARL